MFVTYVYVTHLFVKALRLLALLNALCQLALRYLRFASAYRRRPSEAALSDRSGNVKGRQATLAIWMSRIKEHIAILFLRRVLFN